MLLTESASVRLALWSVISDLLVSGKVRPVVAKVFALEDAADGLGAPVRPGGAEDLTQGAPLG